jgi:type IV secretory pathway component VirB8|tara:strand:- start:743 stop:967 length:225 start_codon:yes stop_codon:yes gene_type:complete
MIKILILILLTGSATLSIHSDSDATVFDDIVAVNDSTRHQYVNIREGENWCWLHNKWENVRIVHSEKVTENKDI